ncbi:hypothetical protein [Duganella qianjiadongensis]|uniref:Uncharacterized protein n=1 Tax=Duganella qianjiadongensis TaxID=2692176 RepID=A0ABW9VL82_9BURK|nr:hypothetical protein [Duganella qianjiadongensis]MYM39645.1 hypothetical protein [Duganella qianjiadongensis]
MSARYVVELDEVDLRLIAVLLLIEIDKVEDQVRMSPKLLKPRLRALRRAFNKIEAVGAPV